MRDARTEITQALIAAINIKIPSKTVYTIVPKPVSNNGTAAPSDYIYISDIYQNDTSPKNYNSYSYEVLIQVVQNNIESKVILWNEMNAIVSIIQSERDLVLTNDFSLMQLSLIASSEEELLTDTGNKYIGLVRFKIDVEDNL